MMTRKLSDMPDIAIYTKSQTKAEAIADLIAFVQSLSGIDMRRYEGGDDWFEMDFYSGPFWLNRVVWMRCGADSYTCKFGAVIIDIALDTETTDKFVEKYLEPNSPWRPFYL